MSICDIPFSDTLGADFLRACNASGGVLFALASAAVTGLVLALSTVIKKTIEEGLQKNALALLSGIILLAEFAMFASIISLLLGLLLLFISLLLAPQLSKFLLQLPGGYKIKLDLAALSAVPVLSLLIGSVELLWQAAGPVHAKPPAIILLPPAMRPPIAVSADFKREILTGFRAALLNDGLKFTKHIEVIPTGDMLGVSQYAEYDNRLGYSNLSEIDFVAKFRPYERGRSIKLVAKTAVYQENAASPKSPISITVRLLEYTPEAPDKIQPIATNDITVIGLRRNYELLTLIAAYRTMQLLFALKGGDISGVEQHVAAAFIGDFRDVSSHLTIPLAGISDNARAILSATSDCAILACVTDFIENLSTVLAQRDGQEDYKANQIAAQQAGRLTREE